MKGSTRASRPCMYENWLLNAGVAASQLPPSPRSLQHPHKVALLYAVGALDALVSHDGFQLHTRTRVRVVTRTRVRVVKVLIAQCVNVAPHYPRSKTRSTFAQTTRVRTPYTPGVRVTWRNQRHPRTWLCQPRRSANYRSRSSSSLASRKSWQQARRFSWAARSRA